MIKHLILTLIILSSVGCSSVRYVSDHLSNQGINKLSSYNIEGECEEKPQRIQKIRVANALHQFMMEEGYERSDNPDYLIQFFIKEENQSYLARECDYYGRWVFGEQCSVKVVNYKEGSIVLDVINTSNQTIVWHGAIYSPPFDNISDPDRKIKAYVKKLLREYLLDRE